MTIALVGDNWWRQACEATGHPFTLLSPPVTEPQRPYVANIDARTQAAQAWRRQLVETQPEFILDNGGTGLAFGPPTSEEADLSLWHETQGVPLASHLIDPLALVLRELPWSVAWQSLQSSHWFKFVWDKSQTDELIRFGIPNVFYLPMAAPDREYSTKPLDPGAIDSVVSFVGGQNTSYFHPQHPVNGSMLLAGTLASAVRADLSDLTFFGTYFDLYGLDAPPSPDHDLQSAARKAHDYFAHKLFYHACSCIRQRDRFVLFLKRQLGETFTLIGQGWDTAYGLDCRPQLPTADDYFNHFRRTAINLNFVNGNSDSGLNMRHFEITAAGGFMLCGHMPEIDDFFAVGTECDTFRNEQELLEKIRYYLEHPERRVEIAQAGQRRTLGQHLYSHRLKHLAEVVQKQASAPHFVQDGRPHMTAL